MLARDKLGLLRKRMEECVDGEYQAFKARDGAYVRKEFFAKYPELLEMVSGMTDDEVWQLRRGGHDPIKVYAAYADAVAHRGQPTVILAKTIKGYGMGAAGEGMNITHQQKKMGLEELKAFRDRFKIPVPDDQIAEVPFYRPAEDSVEMQYLRERRKALSGSLPQRRRTSAALEVPPLVGLRLAAQEHRRSRGLDHDGFRADSFRPWCATRTSATASCRSSPTNRAPSAWKGCSASSEFSRRSASSISPRIPAS